MPTQENSALLKRTAAIIVKWRLTNKHSLKQSEYGNILEPPSRSRIRLKPIATMDTEHLLSALRSTEAHGGDIAIKPLRTIDYKGIIISMIKVELEKLLERRSLYWLSQQTGIRWATLSKMQNGKAQRINLEDIDLICDALECAPGDLFTKVERKPRKKGR